MKQRKHSVVLLAEARQYLNQAYVHSGSHEYQDALRECEAAIRIAPDWAEAHNLRGIILGHLNANEEAIGAYREAIRLDPAFREAQDNLSKAEAALTEREEESLALVEQTAGEPEPGPALAVSVPPAESTTAPSIEDTPACSVCGRQDETLRAVSYPFVISLLVVTFRRALVGLWCRRHRNRRLALAGVITSTLGWIGIPFGFLYTPLTLLKLARGGDQSAELNVRLLERVAATKLASGDPHGAIRCIEATHQFGDSPENRDRLRHLYRRYGPEPEGRSRSSVLRIVGAMLGALIVGAVVGIIDFAIEAGLAPLLGGEVSIYVAILSWTPLITMAFVGGLVVRQMVEDALARTGQHRLSSGVSLAILSALLAVYGLPTGRAIGQYASSVLSSPGPAMTGETFTTIGAVVTRGGAWVMWEALQSTESFDILYVALVLVCAVYYFAASLSGAVRTVRWQQRLASLAEASGAPQAARPSLPVWVAISSVALGLAVLVWLFPQHGLVDYFDATARTGRASELLFEGEPDAAIRELQEAVALDPGSAGAHSGLGWAYYAQGRLSEALQEFQEAIRLQPDLADAHDGLGWVHYFQGEIDDAVREFQEAIRLQPDLADAHDGLGWAYYVQDQPDEAERGFREAIRLDPELADAYAGLGSTYYLQGRLDEAIKELRVSILLNPESADAHAALGQIYHSEGQTEKAIEELKKAVKLAPGWVVAHDGLGWVYFSEGQIDMAAEEFEEALRLDGGWVAAHLGLGWIHVARGEFEEAVEQIEALVMLQPEWGAPYALLAMAYYELDQVEPMERAMEEALQYEGQDALTSYMLGSAYSSLRQFSQAEAHLLDAIDLAPDSEGYYVTLAHVYRAQKRFDDAFRACERALELDEDNVGAYVARADIHVAREELGQAVEELARALEIAPEDGDAHSTLSYVYYHLGRLEEALSEAEEAIRLQPYLANAHTNLALARHARGELDMALAAAQEAVRLAPKNDLPRYILGLCHLDDGENELAAAEFEAFLELFWDRAYVRDYKAQAEAYLADLR